MKSNNGMCNILVLNCGSSSLKYRIYRMPGEKEICRGEAERVGLKTSSVSRIIHAVKDKITCHEGQLASHADALHEVLKIIEENTKDDPDVSFDCVAHRYVHPGKYFNKTVVMDDRNMELLKKTLDLAPIHNPISYSLLDYFYKNKSDLPQYLVFDSSFHTTIPEEYSTYAIPLALTKKYGLRKVGFHGISHNYVMEKGCGFLGVKPEQQKIISCHLGTGGASICAIQEGVSINSSMGFSPLEGLIMNTRSGDIDIGFILQSMYLNNYSADEVEKLLNEKSGVLGVYNKTSDLRDIIKVMDTDPKAMQMVNMSTKRIIKYIGYYSILLKKADCLIFTDTLGETQPRLREKICESFQFLGVKIDKSKNDKAVGILADISMPDSEVKILVVPTNEELMIAKEAFKELINGHNN